MDHHDGEADDTRPSGSPDRDALDRRAAMKAALAGAAAAAVWTAPRIEGLSVAPDVAQAQTCTDTVVNGTHAAVIQSDPTRLECWGLLEGGACNDFTETLTLLAPFTATIRIGGSDFATPGPGFGFVQLTVNGIDPPFESCQATITTNCAVISTSETLLHTFNTNETFPADPATNANTADWGFSCNAGNQQSGNVDWNITCICV